ncbi:MAG: pilus assembly PilX N-terminal domain-containing protein [Alkalibacterium sp.]|nr:pilus assembly PilX N-terminal domain-containing protein [Alkalibacterium sp.]
MKMKMISYYKKEEGSGLILALMTLMVLSVLGASLGAITIGSFRLSSVNRDTTSAYYIAEAGVNQAYEDMRTIVLNAYDDSSSPSSFLQQIDSLSSEYIAGKQIKSFGPQFGDSPEAFVHLEKKSGPEVNTTTFTLSSEGSVDNKSRVVQKSFDVTWVDKTIPSRDPIIPTGVALTIRNTFKVESGTLQGDLYLDSIANRPIIINNAADNELFIDNLYVNDLETDLVNGPGNHAQDHARILNGKKRKTSSNIDWTFYSNIFTNLLEQSESFKTLNSNFNQTGLVLLNDNSRRGGLLNFRGNNTIRIPEGEVNLLVDSLQHSWGRTVIEGEGTLNIYVKNNIDFNSGTFNPDKKNVRIYQINNSTVTIKGGDSVVYASIIAPNSSTAIEGSGKLFGNLMTNSASITGKGMLTYSPFNFHEEIIEENDSDDTQELIKPQPVVEP